MFTFIRLVSMFARLCCSRGAGLAGTGSLTGVCRLSPVCIVLLLCCGCTLRLLHLVAVLAGNASLSIDVAAHVTPWSRLLRTLLLLLTRPAAQCASCWQGVQEVTLSLRC